MQGRIQCRAARTPALGSTEHGSVGLSKASGVERWDVEGNNGVCLCGCAREAGPAIQSPPRV
jgi:hypothetical protein